MHFDKQQRYLMTIRKRGLGKVLKTKSNVLNDKAGQGLQWAGVTMGRGYNEREAC
jgi:hypothetical protein